MDKLSIAANIGNVVCGITAIVALFISVFTYVHTMNTERMLKTLSALSEIRKKYFNTAGLSDHDKLKYLNELEYFSTGINQKIYTIRIVHKTSGSRLIKQYDTWAKDLIDKRRCQFANMHAYCEYETMIKKLRKMKRVIK